MAYELQAVIASSQLLRAVSEGLTHVRLAQLGHGVSLLPITDEFFDEVSDGGASGAMGFWRMPGGFDQVIAQWSVSGAVAYVEAEYFGGIGEQRAAVWTDSAVVLGPLHVAEQQPFPAQGSPISQALRRIGVTSDGAVDEFAAVGLDRHRHMDDWLSG